MKLLITSFSLVRLPDPSQNFRLFPDFPSWCGEPVGIIISETYFMENSQKKKKKKKRNWWEFLRLFRAFIVS